LTIITYFILNDDLEINYLYLTLVHDLIFNSSFLIHPGVAENAPDEANFVVWKSKHWSLHSTD